MSVRVQYNKLNTQAFIERSTKIWGSKYDYSKTEYIDSTHKVCIVCPLHGEFQQIPSNHYKYGCGACGRSLNVRNRELNSRCKQKFVEKSCQIHQNKYTYLRSEYIDAVTKIVITCLTHGDFAVSPNNHLRGKGCPSCGLEVSRVSRLKPYDEYLEKFKILYDNKYDYSKVKWNGSSSAISVICQQHGAYTILPYLHIRGKGCPKCSNRYSKISIEWLSYMEVSYNTTIQHALNGGEFQIPNTRYKADGYSKEQNIIFEFQGDFWHGNPKVYESHKINPRCGVSYEELYSDTNEKLNKIRKYGYKVIFCWESDWNKLKHSIVALQKIWRTRNNENQKIGSSSSFKNN